MILGHALMRAYIKSLMNTWMQKFYDVGGAAPEVSSGDADALDAGAARVVGLLWEFALLCLPSVLVHPIFKLLTNRWVLSWRLALIEDYLLVWKPYEHRIENSSQRIHEDTQRFARGVQTICMVILDCVLTLFVFVPVLVELGGAIQPSPRTGAWLFLLCAGLAGGGMLVSIALGWKLVGLEIQNQRVEADLRKILVLKEEESNISTPVYIDPEAVVDADCSVLNTATNKDASPEIPTATIINLRANYVKLYNNFAVFSFWLMGYEQSVVILPYVLVAPLLYAKENRVTLGKVTQTSHAFGNVFDALSVLSDRWVEFTEFVSVVKRLREWESVVGEGPKAKLVEIQSVSSTDRM
jgi:peptide/bleomycin uptake transporter